MEYDIRLLSNGILKSKFEMSYIGYVDDVVEVLESMIKEILDADLVDTFDEQKRVPIESILDVLCGIDNDVTLRNITMSTPVFVYKQNGCIYYQIIDNIDIKMREEN